MPLLLANIAPALALFAYIHAFAIDVPVADSWTFVRIISSVLEGSIPWQGLIGLHVGYPYAVPRFLMLALALVTGWNITAEMYLIAVLLVLETVLLYLLIRHAWPSRTLVLILPISWLICNLKQSETLLITWNLGLVLSNLCFVAAVVALTTHPNLRGAIIAAACGCLGSLSFGSGLLIWPALLVWFAHYVRWSRADWRHVVKIAIPCLTGAILSWTVFLWLRIIDPEEARFTILQRDPWTTLASIGQLIGYIAANDGHYGAAIGWPLLVLCGVALVLAFGNHQFSAAIVRAGLSLVTFSLLNAVIIVLTRLQLDAPRYTTIMILLLIGLYLILLSALEHRHSMLFGALLPCMILVTLVGVHGGLYIGQMLHGRAIASRYIVQTYTVQHHSQLIFSWTRVEYIYQQIPLLQRHRLSAFRDRQPDYTQLPRHDIPTPAVIDMVNYQPARCEEEPIGLQRSAAPAVVLSGWAVDGPSGKPATAVLLVIDDQQRIPTLYDRRVDSPLPADVASIGPQIGFWASFATALLDPGEHTLTVEVISADAQRRLVGTCRIRLRITA